jgi:hypothetical protein
MATYKLMQDIEAEDKILGPLTLRQFIFALVGAFFSYLSFLSVTKHVAFLLLVFLPPALFCVFFAFPFGRDQPTEIWFLAKLRFWFLPRKRIWNQSGVKQLVTITVPKKVERILTNGLSQTEVKSRLNALASTLDSRGWAVKNVNVYSQPAVVGGDGDRLIDLSNFPQEVPDEDPAIAANDIMDPSSSPVAQKVGSMVDQSTQAHRQQLIDEMSAPMQPAPSSDGWFTGQGFTPQAVATSSPLPPVQAAVAQTVPLAQTPDEALISQQLRQHNNVLNEANEHLRTMRPLGQPSTPPASTSTTVTTSSDPAILSLASNDDLSVATLAHEAHKAKSEEDQPPDEVVISLH